MKHCVLTQTHDPPVIWEIRVKGNEYKLRKVLEIARRENVFDSYEWHHGTGEISVYFMTRDNDPEIIPIIIADEIESRLDFVTITKNRRIDYVSLDN